MSFYFESRDAGVRCTCLPHTNLININTISTKHLQLAEANDQVKNN